MPYYLGVDLGTTYTAAAVWRDGRAEVATLGTRAPVIPSVVLLRDDGTVLTGEAAARRAVTEPQRVAREFKRRFGDPTPIMVGGSPYSADSLMARLLRWVVDSVAEREGSPPAGIAVSHPANWGPFKLELFAQTLRLADIDNATMLTEPEAAVIHYASQERVEPGAVVAVYDLGGGTFDSAVLRRTAAGWEILGEPEGVERLGGLDFDEAVFNHVREATGDAIDRLDPDDPAALSAMGRLRQECVEAKEALASDVDVTIPVLLPTLQADVRMTRAELEGMIRPTLADSVGALRRALRSAEVQPAEVSAVLLVGGSSRIPLVAQLVGSELGRPVAVDAHPKHGVALGAAIVAAERAAGSALNTEVIPTIEVMDFVPGRQETAPPPPPPSPLPSEPLPSPATVPSGQVTVPAPRLPPPAPEPAPTPPAGTPAVGDPGPRERADVPPPTPWARPGPGPRRRFPIMVGAAAAVVVALVVAFLVTRDGAGQEASEVVVNGTEQWTDTGIELSEGDQVQVTATGTVFHNEAESTGPDGFSGNPALDGPLGSDHHGGLIGRITQDGEPFLVGTSTDFTADQEGRLFLGINDIGVENNRGEFDATVTVTPGRG